MLTWRTCQINGKVKAEEKPDPLRDQVMLYLRKHFAKNYRAEYMSGTSDIHMEDCKKLAVAASRAEPASSARGLQLESSQVTAQRSGAKQCRIYFSGTNQVNESTDGGAVFVVHRGKRVVRDAVHMKHVSEVQSAYYAALMHGIELAAAEGFTKVKLRTNLHQIVSQVPDFSRPCSSYMCLY